MFKCNKAAQAVKIALLSGVTATALVAPSAFAEEESKKNVERIEVTGSAITRTDLEGALPVTTISKEDIVKTGVTSVPDLVAQIPQMQGFTTAGESVGGSGGGVQTASLRDLGGAYTLVLLNGRRMATSGSGATVDLNSIPLSAIERVEVLTDGASALYGSDAIAGVINFILKKDVNKTTVTARFDKPQESGGESSNFSIATGFGDLDDDGFNVMVSYSRDQQNQLRSVDRDFAKTGFLPFTFNDQQLVSISGSSNAIPGNAYVTYNTRDEDGDLVFVKAAADAPKIDDMGRTVVDSEGYSLDKDGNRINKTATYSVNPYRVANGDCHNQSAPSTTSKACVFDYTSTLEIAPESERDNVFLQGVMQLGESAELYSTVSWSDFSMISRIAPYPTGGIALDYDSALVQDNVIPHLPEQIKKDATGKISARWRALPGGNRTNEYHTETTHIVAGLRGEYEEVNYDFAITSADSQRDNNRITGYPIEKPFLDLLKSGKVNLFDSPENLSEDQIALVKETMYSGLWESTETSLLSLEGKASMAIAELDAGEMYIAAGFDYREVDYSRSNSQANDDEIILFESASPIYDLSRETYGLFVESVAPITDELEVTAALRYDNIGATTDAHRAAGSQVVNSDVDDTTYKVSAVYRPNEEWVLRASFGTGFKAPSMRQIAEPRVEFGVTSVAYDCPLASNHPLRQYCHSDKLQYDVYREGYADLKPETSEQISAGFVYAPDSSFSFGMDYWQVDLEEQVARLTQDQIFNNPELYNDLFTTKFDKGTNEDVLAIIQAAVNIGKSNNSGIDWHLNKTTEFSFGELKTSWTGTYVLKSESLRVGTDNVWDSSLGRVDSGSVTFRTIMNLTNTFSHGDFSHTARIKYRSSYDDVIVDDAVLASDWSEGGYTAQLVVPSYVLVDWLTTYHAAEGLNVSFGIKNLFDKQPPLTLNGDAGHQVGYDPRYADPYGRTFYVNASYTF